uniref:Uncharacterized protein n=1 Tax=virus sp. ct9pU4 TaxID=2828248 RepID=A0A8S5RBT3_9VIRU|nr:MAG TPA: hypothetical protein [virus sp. ct9pU4]DAK20354.1 MAG TPA: hypothetical protein [Bacteriophage sp.]
MVLHILLHGKVMKILFISIKMVVKLEMKRNSI